VVKLRFPTKVFFIEISLELQSESVHDRTRAVRPEIRRSQISKPVSTLQTELEVYSGIPACWVCLEDLFNVE